ncbi:MAG TPA: DUF2188 domain-containing protein [Thermoanaerobaculia bacterium]
MSKPRVKQVLVSPGGKGWRVTADGAPVCEQRTKEVAIDYAIKEARRGGGPARLCVQRRDGTLQEERTYGVKR